MPSVQTTIDMQVYRLTAVKKAAYRVANRCTVVLGTLEGALLPLTLSLRRSASNDDLEEALRLFHQELLDEELRATIREETEPLRALILAQTFSRANLIEDHDG